MIFKISPFWDMWLMSWASFMLSPQAFNTKTVLFTHCKGISIEQ